MKILYFDVAAFLILVIIMFSLVFRKMLSGRSNRFYAILLIQILLTTIADFWSESYGVWIPATESNMPIRSVFMLFLLLPAQSDNASLSSVYLFRYRYLAYPEKKKKPAVDADCAICNHQPGINYKSFPSYDFLF